MKTRLELQGCWTYSSVYKEFTFVSIDKIKVETSDNMTSNHKTSINDYYIAITVDNDIYTCFKPNQDYLIIEIDDEILKIDESNRKTVVKTFFNDESEDYFFEVEVSSSLKDLLKISY